MFQGNLNKKSNIFTNDTKDYYIYKLRPTCHTLTTSAYMDPVPTHQASAPLTVRVYFLESGLSITSLCKTLHTVPDVR